MKTTVQTTMSPKVVVASVDHKFSQVLEFFSDFHVHHIPVTEHDFVIGIISAKDVIKHLRKNFTEHNGTVSMDTVDKEITIRELMTDDPKTLVLTDTVQHAAELFSKNKFHSLPVVKEGKIQGILTTKDIAKHVSALH